MNNYNIILRGIFIAILVFGNSTFTLKGQPQKKTATLKNSRINAVVSLDGLVSFRNLSDPFDGILIGERSWGRTLLRYTIEGQNWLVHDAYNRSFIEYRDTAAGIIDYGSGMPLKMEQRYTLNDRGLDFDIFVESMMQFPVTIGDLAVHFPERRIPRAWTAWRTGTGESLEYIDGYILDLFEKNFIEHDYISGHGSFLYYTRRNGQPPYLMVLPKEGTKLEYFDRSGNLYIHSGYSGNQVEGSWRQEHTYVYLDSAGGRNTKLHYGFKLRWADSYEHMRQILYEEGLFDIRVVPGMTLPAGLKAKFSLHTKNSIDSVIAEFPDKTEIAYIGKKMPDHHIYEVEFSKLGENMLTIHYNEDKKTYLEFFSTEPLETLIKKRSSFIVNKQQHRNPDKWYDGLFSIYDMKEGVLRGPDNDGGFKGWNAYVLACDDPALSKAPFVAAKNVYYPVDREIEAIEYYLENFVWGGLQRTDKEEPYPYGIYGVPNWKVARDLWARTGIRSGQLDRMQVWRSYDYAHIAMLYYHMYQIADMYPEKVNYITSDEYLERAYRTAMAFFTYPYEIWGEYYETYKIGCYNELVIENIINDLEKEGRTEAAEKLRGEYEKKVKYFIYDDKYPYASEFATDRTAFESSYAFAKYAMLNKMEPDSNLWYDIVYRKWYSHPEISEKKTVDFMKRQHLAGLAVRGWLETSYFQLGADNSLSYMAKMGGWSILDYGINFADKPYDWIQLGYASWLSSWALMNTGTSGSNYGFWSPGEQNDGAMGWAYVDYKGGRSQNRSIMGRGARIYCGEADLGNGAAMRIATTVLSQDPLFGWTAYGGTLKQTGETYSVKPKDGVRCRFSLVSDEKRYSIELDRDGFAKHSDIEINKRLDNLKFKIENRIRKKHETLLMITLLPGEDAKVKIDNKTLPVKRVNDRTHVIKIPVEKEYHTIQIKIL